MTVISDKKKELEDEMNLGEILRLLGHATTAQINTAAQEQQSTGEKIGQALVRMLVVTQETIDEAITLQKDLRGLNGGKAAAKAAARLASHTEELVKQKLEAMAFDSAQTDPDLSIAGKGTR